MPESRPTLFRSRINLYRLYHTRYKRYNRYTVAKNHFAIAVSYISHVRYREDLVRHGYLRADYMDKL